MCVHTTDSKPPKYHPTRLRRHPFSLFSQTHPNAYARTLPLPTQVAGSLPFPVIPPTFGFILLFFSPLSVSFQQGIVLSCYAIDDYIYSLPAFLSSASVYWYYLVLVFSGQLFGEGKRKPRNSPSPRLGVFRKPFHTPTPKPCKGCLVLGSKVFRIAQHQKRLLQHASSGHAPEQLLLFPPSIFFSFSHPSSRRTVMYSFENRIINRRRNHRGHRHSFLPLRSLFFVLDSIIHSSFWERKDGMGSQGRKANRGGTQGTGVHRRMLEFDGYYFQ